MNPTVQAQVNVALEDVKREKAPREPDHATIQFGKDARIETWEDEGGAVVAQVFNKPGVSKPGSSSYT